MGYPVRMCFDRKIKRDHKCSIGVIIALLAIILWLPQEMCDWLINLSQTFFCHQSAKERLVIPVDVGVGGDGGRVPEWRQNTMPFRR